MVKWSSFEVIEREASMRKREGFLINREGFGGLRISGNGADIATETVIDSGTRF